MTIGDNVAIIGEGAFSGCHDIFITIENPNCVIYDWGKYLFGNIDCIIYGYDNSTAKDYAERFSVFNVRFVSLMTPPENTIRNIVIPDECSDENYTEGVYNGLKYRKYSAYIAIMGYDSSFTKVIIPEQIEGLPVASIESKAFRESVL